LAAAGVTWWTDEVFLHRIANGTDHAVRLAAILTYVGVDGSYSLARALGVTALGTAYLSVAIGLVGSRGPGAPWLGPVHRQIGVLTLVLVAGHAAVPFTSVFRPPGGWRTVSAPFGQPVSWGIHAASWESFGILAFYLLLLTGPTYYLIGSRSAAWSMVHRLTAVVYALSVAHAFLLGTDFLVRGPARVVLLAAQIPLLVLLAWRLAPVGPSARRRLRWFATSTVATGTAIMLALTVLVATGDYAPGLRL
jgi:predicted ferric reductase